MAQPDGGIGNVTANTSLVAMAMAYSRSRVVCAAAQLGVADALGEELRHGWDGQAQEEAAPQQGLQHG